MSIIWYDIAYCLKIYIDRGFYELYQQIQLLNATVNPIPKSPNVNLVVLYNISIARLQDHADQRLVFRQVHHVHAIQRRHNTERLGAAACCSASSSAAYGTIDLNLHFDILFSFLQNFLFFICFMTIGYFLRCPTLKPSIKLSRSTPSLIPTYISSNTSTNKPAVSFSARQVSSGKEPLEYFYYMCL
jgi:hypothetical protein